MALARTDGLYTSHEKGKKLFLHVVVRVCKARDLQLRTMSTDARSGSRNNAAPVSHENRPTLLSAGQNLRCPSHKREPLCIGLPSERSYLEVCEIGLKGARDTRHGFGCRHLCSMTQGAAGAVMQQDRRRDSPFPPTACYIVTKHGMTECRRGRSSGQDNHHVRAKKEPGASIRPPRHIVRARNKRKR